MAFLFAYDKDLSITRSPSRIPSHQGFSSSPLDTPLPTTDATMDEYITEKNSASQTPTPQRRHIVLPDHVAFKYLEEDPAVSVVRPKCFLQGYELYVVEQWACSRRSPTLVIATYTGDQRHSIVVGVLAVPADEKTWSSRLKVFFRAIQQHHGRPKETPLGELMVTNLSSFPSALTVIPVPDGDIRKHQKSFMVNENLKRMGCSGRSGLTLTNPTQATQAKFYQLYKASTRIPLFQAVLELVKMCQVALFIFGNLDQEYTDGLLCDVTETAIRNWWTSIGTDYYNIEPTDGILGPTTVAALLGTLMGARNRLHSFGVTVSKDVFDIDSTRRAISHFQKSQKYERTGRLDRQTLLRLQSLTAKAASGEGWGVQKAVKSTMAEIGGKRGEIVMGMVSGRDKAGIGDIETADIDRFISLTTGERAKWLWHGKPRRTGAFDAPAAYEEIAGMLTRQDTRSSRTAYSLPAEEDSGRLKKDETFVSHSQPSSAPPIGMADSPVDRDRDNIGKAVFKSVAGKVSDARSGLGRIKDTIGGSRRTHSTRPSLVHSDFIESGIISPGLMVASPIAPPGGPIPRAFTWKNKPGEYADAFKHVSENGDIQYNPAASQSQRPIPPLNTILSLNGIRDNLEVNFDDIAGAVRKDVVEGTISVPGSVTSDGDLLGPLLMAERASGQPLCSLHRRHTMELARPTMRGTPNESRWSRRLSFGDAEEAILRWDEIVDIIDFEEILSGKAGIGSGTFSRTNYLEELARSLNQKILDIKRDIEPWAAQNIKAVEALDGRFSRNQEDLQTLAAQLAEVCRNVSQAAAELVAEERSSLTKGLKEVEMLLARLEYEMNTLVSKVEDVEDSVIAYERQVEDVERRVEELKIQLETESWLHWFVRTLTGIGTGPNITREVKVQ
ncbi:hypothetical protein jhhlp_005214 [Lomentospora prolificans]|uniref:STB6-like N-terminal domain-containing protein n=1 Tax=Lomentospora prolificans TaxID=41688 RepID=A0A2N3N759_9PEZI|nr:hypothetical protein jhhlp_005214 [Lomentospora prolificans]